MLSISILINQISTILWGPPTSEIRSRKRGSCKDESFGTLHEAVKRKQNPNCQHHFLHESIFLSSFILSFIFHSSHFNPSLRLFLNSFPIKLHRAFNPTLRWQQRPLSPSPQSTSRPISSHPPPQPLFKSSQPCAQHVSEPVSSSS